MLQPPLRFTLREGPYFCLLSGVVSLLIPGVAGRFVPLCADVQQSGRRGSVGQRKATALLGDHTSSGPSHENSQGGVGVAWEIEIDGARIRVRNSARNK